MSPLDPAAVPFSAALLLVLLLVGAEIIGALVGILPSAMLDSAMPDIGVDADAGDALADAPEVGGAPGAITGFLAWLSLGKVPALIILVVFLASFGLIGLLLLSLSASLVGLSLPMVASVPVAVLLGLYPTRWAGRALSGVFRNAEVTAPSAEDFVGRLATVTGGTATRGLPAEGKVTDGTGQTHYVRIEPEADDTFAPGTSVLITERVSSVYKAIPNPSESLERK